MWILSELESSISAVQLEVGSKFDAPTLCYAGDQAPLPNLVTSFDIDVSRYLKDSRVVWMGDLGEGSTTIVADATLQHVGAHRIEAYLLWDPYWYVEFADQPRLRGMVTSVGVITADDIGRLNFNVGVTFTELEHRARTAEHRVVSRCLNVRAEAV